MCKSKLSIFQELEKLKQKHSEEIKRIEKQQLEDKELYEKEKEELLSQRTELEQELYHIKNKIQERDTQLPCISYD